MITLQHYEGGWRDLGQHRFQPRAAEHALRFARKAQVSSGHKFRMVIVYDAGERIVARGEFKGGQIVWS